MTSISPNENTLRLLEEIRAIREPFVVTCAGARERLDAMLLNSGLKLSASFVDDFDDYANSARRIVIDLERTERSLVDWINVTDSTTPTYLFAAQLLDARWPSLNGYRNCRLKPVAREVANGVCGGRRVEQQVVRVTDPGIEKLADVRQTPFIAKPVCGTASRHVRLIRSSPDWQDYVANARRRVNRQASGDQAIAGFRPDRDILVEDFLVGDAAGVEFEIDGYVCGGRSQPCAIGYKFHDYGNEAGFRELGGVLSSLGSGLQVEAIVAPWLWNCLDAMEFHNGVFHVEAVISGGEIGLIEINPRQGGGEVVEMVKQLSGVDLLQAVVPLWLGQTESVRPPRTSNGSITYAILHPHAAGKVAGWRETTSLRCSVMPGNPEATWKPSLGLYRDKEVDPMSGEEYLGELTLRNSPIAPEALGDAMRRLQQWMIDQGLVTIV